MHSDTKEISVNGWELEQDAQRLEILNLPWAWSSAASDNWILLQAGVWIKLLYFYRILPSDVQPKIKTKQNQQTNQPKPSTFLGKCLSQLQAHSSTHCCALSALAPYQETFFRQVLSKADLVEMVNQSSQVCWCKNNSMEMELFSWEWMKEWTGEVVKWLQSREKEA